MDLEKVYADSISNAQCAFAYHEGVFDDAGEMVDYIFLDVNKAFEEITGLKKEDVIGKRFVRDIIRDEEHGVQWVKIYERTVKEKVPIEFEEYSKENRKYFSVKAFSPENDRFVSLIMDRTIEKKLQEIVQYFIDSIGDNVDYECIAKFACDISGADYAVFNLFDKNGLDFTTVAVQGVNERFKKLSKFLGFEIVGKKWPYDPTKEEKTKGQEITIFNALHDLTGTKIPKEITLRLEKVFKIGIVAVAKIRKDGKDLGDFTLIFKKNNRFKNEELFLLYLSQLGLFLEKNRLASELNESQKMFYTLAEYAPVGFLSCNTKGTITYANKRLIELMGSSSYDTTKKINLLEFTNLTECGFSQKLKECMQNEKNIEYEFAYKSLWGKFNWLRSYFTPIKENNTVIGANIVIDDITDNKTFEYDLKEKVFRDPLTRAYNRHALENKLPSRLSEVKLKGTISCIAIVDIDNFKEINDNFGHKAGDAVLKYLATRVKKELREDDLFIRTGGDEFLIYLHDIREEKNASNFIKRIFDKITGSYRLMDENDEPYKIYVSCSIGASFFPKDGSSVETLMAKADKALYKVKNSGKSNYQIELSD
ncbi:MULTISPECIES: diguanylate cyclase [Synergistaceae]|uniref:diguanylate cyclase n=1 Tax=Synergistaceae TaxID=649777 RepID=UPI003AEBEA03|nr:diguanylate cyclase [Synergistaceae bacterium DZ-S4]